MRWRENTFLPTSKASSHASRFLLLSLTPAIAAKSALRRKKQFEHSLEQTSSQIMTLEREIYSIETANINKETLDAMKNAGNAMKQIHSGLTIDKVDNVMYAFCTKQASPNSLLIMWAGRTSASNTQSAKRLAKPSPRASPPTASTKTNWTRNSQSYNKKSSTSKCSTLATCPSTMPHRHRSYHRHQVPTPRHHSGLKRTTKRRSCGSYRLRWPCKRLCQLNLLLSNEHSESEWRGFQAYGDINRSGILGLSFFFSIYNRSIWALDLCRGTYSTYEIRRQYQTLYRLALFFFYV